MDDVLKEIKERKSVLLFKEDIVTQSLLDKLIKAAQWAPSCFNKQSWNYVFIGKDDSNREQVEQALLKGNMYSAKASHLVVIGARAADACDNNDIPYSVYDCGLSVMSMVLQAQHLGICMHQMAGFDGVKMKEAVGFPEDMPVIVVAAVGYEDTSKDAFDGADERIKNRLKQERIRKNPSENFFYNKYK